MTSDLTVDSFPKDFFEEVPEIGSVEDYPEDFFTETEQKNLPTYLQDSDRTIGVPQGVPPIEAEYLDGVQNRNENPDDYVGMNKVGQFGRGFTNFVASLPQAEAGVRIRSAELMKEELKKDFSFLDVPDALFTPGDESSRGAWMRIKRAMGIDISEEEQVFDRLLESGNALLKNNREFLIENNLVKKEGDGIFFDIGSGAASIPLALGMTVITRRPDVVALMFGSLQKENSYVEAREKGFSVEAADKISTVMGVAEGSIEILGNMFFLKALGADKFIKRVVMGAAEEGLQEAAQTGAEEIITQTSGLREKDIAGGLQRVLYSAAIGVIVGAPTTTILDLATKQGKKAGLPDKLVESAANKIIAEQKELVEAAAQVIVRETSPNNKDKKKEAETVKIMQDFLNGAEIDTTKFDTARKEELDKILSEAEPRQKQLREGRIKQLEQELDGIDAEISDLSNQINERLLDDRPVKALEKKLEKIIEERDILGKEVVAIEGNTLAKVDPKKDVKVKAGTVENLNERITKQSIRAANRAFLRARSATRRDIRDVQTELTELIRTSGLSKKDQASFIRTIKNIQTKEQLDKRMPKVEAQITEKLNKARKEQSWKNIKKSLKSVKVKMSSGKPVSKTTAGKVSAGDGKSVSNAQKAFDSLNKISKLSKAQAEQKMEDRVKELSQTNAAPDYQTVLENKLLSYISNRKEYSADNMDKLEQDIQALVDAGKAAGQARVLKKLEEETKLREGVEAAISNINPKIKKKTLVDNTKKAWKKAQSDKKKKSLSQFFIGMNGVWRTKMKYIFTGKDYIDGEGESRSVEELIDQLSLHKEARVYEVGKRDSAIKLNTMLLEASGFANIKQLDRYLIKSENDILIHQEYTMADGTTKLVSITRAQARKRWMELKDKNIEETIYHKEGNNWTKEIVNDIETKLDPEDFRLVNAQLDFYRDYYKRINKKYEEVYGISLPKVENYSPISRKIGKESETEMLAAITYRGGVAPGSLKSRKPNIRPLNQQSDREAMYSHLTEMEYFLAYIDKVSLLDRVFNKDHKVHEMLEERYGKGIVDTIKADLDYFNKRGMKHAAAGVKFFNTLIRNFGTAQLASKPQIGLKQLTSFPAYADDVKISHFMEGLTYAVTHPKKALNELRESSVWTERGIQNLDKDFQDLFSDKSFLTAASKNKGLVSFMFFPIKYGDKGAIFLGGYARYYARRKQGYSKPEALADFEKKTSATQQSADMDQLSEWQRGQGIERLVVQFMSSPNALARAEIEALIDYSRGRKTGGELAKTLFIYHLLIPNFFAMAVNGFQWETEDQLQASILGSLGTGLFLVGDLFEAIVALTVSGEWFSPGIRHPGEFADELLIAADEIHENGIYLEDFLEGTRAIEKGAKGTGALYGIPLQTWYGQMLGVKDLAEGDMHRGTLRLLGYSEWAIDKKILK